MAISGLKAGLESVGHDVRVLRPRWTAPSHDLTRLAFNLALSARLRDADADLVVGFDLDGWALNPAPRPYVVALKGVAADERRFETGLQGLRFSVLTRLERRNARRADLVLVTSGYSRDTAVGAYGLAPERVRIVPEGIDARAWEQAWPGPRPGPDRAGGRVLTVARQYRRKNTARLIEAVSLLRAHRPRLELEVIGGGPELPSLRRLVSRLELADAVRFRGPLEGLDALLAAYRRADVFCLPSRQEGFGIVFLEAMAAGLPIVAARAGATPEVAPEGVASLLVPPDRADLLAAALDRVLADADLRERLSEGGRARWRAYDWPEVARRFLAATRLAPGEGPTRY